MRNLCYNEHQMRTTLNIEDDALLMIKKYAEERGIALGQAVSDLVHRGAESLAQFHTHLQTRNGWVVFELPPEAPTLTNELLDDWKKEEHEEEFRDAFSPRR